MSDVARIRERFSRGLIDQAAEEGVSLTLRREEELRADSSLALAALGAMVGGAIQTDFALVYAGEVGGLRYDLPRGSPDRQDPIRPPDFTHLLQ